MNYNIRNAIKTEHLTTLKQLYHKFPEVDKSVLKSIFNENKLNKYIKRYNKEFMGNKFSQVRNVYQMDIYFQHKTPYLLLVNVNTKYAWISKLKSKNTNDVLQVFEKAYSELNLTGVECDNEKAFNSYRFIDFLIEHNIKMKVSVQSLHSELTVINRLSRTIRAFETDPIQAVKLYNKRYNDAIKTSPNEMQTDPNLEAYYVYNQLAIRDTKDKLLLSDDYKLEVGDKVRYVLDEDEHRMKKNKFRYKLSKYYYLIETVRSPYLYDITAADGTVKTLPRYRLYKLNKSETKLLNYAKSIEDESNYMIYDEIIDYLPKFKRDGKLNIEKTKYVVRIISRTKTGKKNKRELMLGIKEVRLAMPTTPCKLELDFLKANSDNYELKNGYIIPK